MYKNRRGILYNIIKIMLTFSMCCILCLMSVFAVYGATSQEEYLQEGEERKKLPIQSDEIKNWPAGPKISAQAAIIMEAETGAILYAKNINEHLYPASVTKMLTALIAVSECEPDEMVTFSKKAVESIDWKNDANLGISVGNSITMEQCLYGLLVGSANEVAYAIAEHISGNIEDFAEKMNKKAKELGCKDSHFITPNGIHDENHYTSAYDLALIAKAFYADELLSKMASTASYKVPQSDTQPRADMVVYAKSKLHAGKEYAYAGLLGTKTGYTDFARQTLVSCAKKNGMKLICVVLKEESPYQYKDTIELLDYGFNNFQAINIGENDKTYVIQCVNFFSTDFDFFGSSKPILQMNNEDYIVLPKDGVFSDTESELSYDNLDEKEIARVNYYFNGEYVGNAAIEKAEKEMVSFDFGTKNEAPVKEEKKEDVVIINITKVLIYVGVVALIFIFIITLISSFSQKRGRGKRRRFFKKSYKTLNSKNPDWRGFK